MAQARKTIFGLDTGPDARPQDAAPGAFSPDPLAIWSQMAEMQRQMLAAMAGGVADKAAAPSGANVTEIRPNAVAAPVAAVSQNWMAAASECQRELARFVSERLASNQAFVSSAMAAQGLAELVQLQAGWMQQTAQDYTHEIGRMSDIVKAGADEALAATA